MIHKLINTFQIVQNTKAACPDIDWSFNLYRAYTRAPGAVDQGQLPRN